MYRVTFFPIGNADCCLIDLHNGAKMLFDYADLRDPDDKSDRRIDLSAYLLDDLGKRRDYDVVAFTHADVDHVHGASDFFFLEHAKKYQGGDRVKIKELWVPAAFIIETGLVGDARVIQAEARHRLREGKDIRVFSQPKSLEKWLEEENLKLKDREHLITDAGTLVPGFTKTENGVEFFVHSPFAKSVNGETVVRNESSLMLQATFNSSGVDTALILTADIPYDVMADVVTVTKNHKNQDRLKWDIINVSHHCSYLALSENRGKDKTEPVPEVAWLFDQGCEHGIIVSTSRPIPKDDADDQPPHRQAANYYKKVASAIEGDFVVTMEHPKITSPEPLVITIDESKATLKKAIASSAQVITSRPAPRAGAQ